MALAELLIHLGLGVAVLSTVWPELTRDAVVENEADAIAALRRVGAAHTELAHALLEDLLDRATMADGVPSWTYAEHRVRPELLTTQTGRMQGAAGIGPVLPRAQAGPSVVLPDEPWPCRARGR